MNMEISCLGKVHHIGVVTPNYEKTAEFYLAIGYHYVVGGYDPYQNVYGYFYECDNRPTIELLMPKDETSPINQIIKKNGVSPYHLCYEVNCPYEEAISELKKNKFMQITRPSISDNLNKRRVCFFYHANVGIVELLENENFCK